MLYHVQVDDDPVKSKIIFEKLALINFKNSFVSNKRLAVSRHKLLNPP